VIFLLLFVIVNGIQNSPFFIVHYCLLGEFEAFWQWWENNLCYHCWGVSNLSLFLFWLFWC
jgi:hypothetical protein